MGCNTVRNKIADQRDRIIFGEEYNEEAYRNGLRYFGNLRRHELRLLMDMRIFDPYPWTKYMEYVWFMERYGNDNLLYLHGFVYSPQRTDGFVGRQNGISIEGIGRDKKWDEKMPEKVFRFLFEEANQFNVDPPYVLYY